MNECKYCGAPLDDDSQFCANCGKKIEPQGKTCPCCRAEVEDDSAFCSKCGTRLNSQIVPPVNTSQIVTTLPSQEEAAEEENVYEWEEEKDRKWWYIIGGIVVAAILFIGGYYLYMHNNKSVSPSNVERRTIALKGIINETIGFSMKLRFKGNEIEGTEHYDKQKTKDTLSIKGSIDDNGNMVLHEYDNNNIECGTFEGVLNDDLYSGTFTNSRGKGMSFSAKVLSESGMVKEEESINKISKIGTIIANVEGKIYYLDKAKPNNEYNDFGKLYIFNIADGTTSNVIIWSIDDGATYSIEECKYRDMKITFVMYDTSRNGFGVGNYCTSVRQYNIITGKWEEIVNECAKAVFIDNNRKLKITTAEITNPEAEFSYEYEFKYSDTIIDL